MAGYSVFLCAVIARKKLIEKICFQGPLELINIECL